MPIASYLQMHPEYFVAVMAILGLIVGSFLNVVIYRLPIMMEREWRNQCRELLALPDGAAEPREQFNLVHPRSRCPRCNRLIKAIDNIPVISYLILRGRCRACKQPISIRYPLVEAASGAASAFLAWHFGFAPATILAAVLTWALICLAMIDFDQRFLPDDITLPFLWLGLAVNLFGVFADIYSSVSGVIAGYGLLWLIFASYRFCTGKEGMGYGDFKLLAMLGAWLGWQKLPLIILLSSLLGALIGITLIALGRLDRRSPIPFGPWLAVAGWVALVWGGDINSIYLNWAYPQ